MTSPSSHVDVLMVVFFVYGCLCCFPRLPYLSISVFLLLLPLPPPPPPPSLSFFPTPQDADGQLVYPLNSAEEKAKFREFALLGEGDPLFQQAGEFWQLACLRARKFDMQRSLELVRNYMIWRRDYAIEENTVYTDPEFKAAVESGAVRACGNKDKDGRYVLTLRLRLTDPKRWPPRYAVRTVHSAIELLLRKFPESQARGIVFVNDMTGAKMSNADSRVPRELFAAFSNKLPLRFGCVYAVNPPLFMRFIWPIVRHFMSRKMQSRMKLLPGGYPQLRNHFSVDQILVENGGQFPHDHDAYVRAVSAMQAQYGSAEHNALPGYLDNGVDGVGGVSTLSDSSGSSSSSGSGADDVDVGAGEQQTSSASRPGQAQRRQAQGQQQGAGRARGHGSSSSSSSSRGGGDGGGVRDQSGGSGSGEGEGEGKQERHKTMNCKHHARKNSVGTLVFV